MKVSCATLGKYACNTSLEVPVGEVKVIARLCHTTRVFQNLHVSLRKQSLFLICCNVLHAGLFLAEFNCTGIGSLQFILLRQVNCNPEFSYS